MILEIQFFNIKNPFSDIEKSFSYIKKIIF